MSDSAKKKLQRAGRALSSVRDVAVVPATLKGLADQAFKADQLSALTLAAGATQPRQTVTSGKTLSRSIQGSRKALKEMASASSAMNGFSQRRLNKAFRDLEEAREAASQHETPLLFHAWRKKAKRLFLLMEVLKPKETRLIDRLDKIQDCLGTYHDAVMLKDKLARESPGAGRKKELKPLMKLLKKQQRHLRKKTEKVARKLPRRWRRH